MLCLTPLHRYATQVLGGPSAGVYFVSHGDYTAQLEDNLGATVTDENFPIDHTVGPQICCHEDEHPAIIPYSLIMLKFFSTRRLIWLIMLLAPSCSVFNAGPARWGTRLSTLPHL